MGRYPCTQDVYKVNPQKKKKSNEPTDLAACSHVYEDHRKKKLRLSYKYSCPTKVHAFISLQRHYIKHNRMNFQVSKPFFLLVSNRPVQQAKTSRTVLGTTQHTPNKHKISDHESLATSQFRER